MHRKSLLAVACCTAAFVGTSATGALAGEIKGPPGTPSSPTNPIPIPPMGGQNGVRDHANSLCAFSGLNDLDPNHGPTDSIVQTPGHFMLAGLTPPGVPGHGTDLFPGFENGCRGGTN